MEHRFHCIGLGPGPGPGPRPGSIIKSFNRGLSKVAADAGTVRRRERAKGRMLFSGGGGGARGAGAAATAGMNLVRYFSRKCAPDVRRINPKVPKEEAKAISQSLYQIIKERGPLSVGNTWNHAKEAGIAGLSSKTHMKIMLKWMRGRRMLKLFCTHHGSAKRFLHSTLPEEPRAEPEQEIAPPAPSDSLQPSLRKEKKLLKKLNKKKKKWGKDSTTASTA